MVFRRDTKSTDGYIQLVTKFFWQMIKQFALDWIQDIDRSSRSSGQKQGIH